MKECGGCTFCCEYLGIPELNKPEKTKCPHACSIGCSIYLNRPKSCQSFRCLWLDSEVMGPDLRPDRSGVLFELYAEERTVVAVSNTEDWQNGESKKLIQQMLDDGYVVWVRHDDKRHLVLPNGVDAVTAQARAESAWRRKNECT